MIRTTLTYLIFVAIVGTGCAERDRLGRPEKEALNLEDTFCNLQIMEPENLAEIDAINWLNQNWDAIFPEVKSLIFSEVSDRWLSDPEHFLYKNNTLNIYINIDDSGEWTGSWLGSVNLDPDFEDSGAYLGIKYQKSEFFGYHSKRQIGISDISFQLLLSGKINPMDSIDSIERLNFGALQGAESVVGGWVLNSISRRTDLVGSDQGKASAFTPIEYLKQSGKVVMSISPDCSVTFKRVNEGGSVELESPQGYLKVYKIIGLGGYAIVLGDENTKKTVNPQEFSEEENWITSSPSDWLVIHNYEGKFDLRFTKMNRFFDAANPNPNSHRAVATISIGNFEGGKRD